MYSSQHGGDECIMAKFIITPKEDKTVTMTIRIDRELQEEYSDLAAKSCCSSFGLSMSELDTDAFFVVFGLRSSAAYSSSRYILPLRETCFANFLSFASIFLSLTPADLLSEFFDLSSKSIYLIGSIGSRTFPSVLDFLFPKNCPCCPHCFLVKHTFPCGIGFHFSCQLRVSAQHFVKFQRSGIVVPAKFGNGTGFLVLSH